MYCKAIKPCVNNDNMTSFEIKVFTRKWERVGRPALIEANFVSPTGEESMFFNSYKELDNYISKKYY